MEILNELIIRQGHLILRPAPREWGTVASQTMSEVFIHYPATPRSQISLVGWILVHQRTGGGRLPPYHFDDLPKRGHPVARLDVA